MSNPFEVIYRKNKWSGGGSGYGSSPAFTQPYRDWLANFLQSVRPGPAVLKVIDFGCGDWQSSKLIDWSGCQYLGYDVVPDVVQRNRELHGREHIQFQLSQVDFTGITDFIADVLIVKDVMQHWPLATVQQFLRLPWQVEYALFVNDTVSPDATKALNADCRLGDYQLRDLALAPFNLLVRNVLSWESPDDPVKFPGRKTVQLWQRSEEQPRFVTTP